MCDAPLAQCASQLLALHILQAFIHMCEERNAYVGDLDAALESLKAKTRKHYIAAGSAFVDGFVFQKYHALLNVDQPGSMLVWHRDLTDEEEEDECLKIKAGDRLFTLGGVPARAGGRGRLPSTPERIYKGGALLATVKQRVEQHAAEAAQLLLDDLVRKYPNSAVLQALRLAYPEYWRGSLQPDGGYSPPTSADVRKQLHVLEVQFGRAATTSSGMDVPAKLAMDKLEDQLVIFADEAKDIAIGVLTDVAADKLHASKVTQAWWLKLAALPGAQVNYAEWLRLGKLALTIVPGSVEAERAFSNVAYLKSKLRNRMLQPHLSVCVRAYSQRAYDLGTFPYSEAITAFLNAKQWRLADESDELNAVGDEL